MRETRVSGRFADYFSRFIILVACTAKEFPITVEVLVVEVPSDEFVSSCFQGPFGREGEPGVPGTDGLSVSSTAKSPSLCLGKIYLVRYKFRPHVCQLDFEQRLSD